MNKFKMDGSNYILSSHAVSSMEGRKIPLAVIMGVLKIGKRSEDGDDVIAMLDLVHSQVFVVITEDGDLVKSQVVKTVYARGKLDNGYGSK